MRNPATTPIGAFQFGRADVAGGGEGDEPVTDGQPECSHRRRGHCPGSIERAARLLSGEPVERVLAEQSLLDDRPCYLITTRYFDTATMLTFLTR